MKSKKLAWMSGLIVTVVGLMAANTALAAEKDDQGVRQAVAQFYTALNAMFTGELGPIKEVWWDQVLATWEGQAAKKLGGKVEPTNMRITVGQDLAIVSDIENGENTNADGKVEKVSIRTTNLLRKEGGKWKMIGHHTDLLPYLAK